MHKTESVLENETQKLLWDFEIKTCHLIPASRPVLVIINKKETLLYSGLYHRVKIKENVKRDKYVAEPISESTPQMNFSLMRASSDNQRQ